ELGQGLVRTDVVVAAPTEAERQDEDVEHAALMPEGHRGRAPDLALLPEWGFETSQGQFGAQLGGPERADEELDGLVTAGVAAPTELLKQDLGRIPHLGSSRAQILGMRSQYPCGPRRALVWSPA